MNPVLIKPEADTRSQVVVLGEVDHALSRLPWRERRARLWPVVRDVAAQPARRLRRRRDRGRGQPGRDQPARRRHRQHGGRARGRGARAAVLRHRPRRRVRAPARHLALPAPRRSASCSRASCSTASAATRRCSRPGPAWLEEQHRRADARRVPWLDMPLPEEDGVALQGAAGDGRHRDRRTAPHREPRRVRAARRARALRAQPGRDRSGRRDRDPRHQEHPRRPRLAAHDRPRRRDHAARGRPACRCSASAAGCRCSAAACAIRTGVEGGGEAHGLGLLDLVTELRAGKTTRRVRVADSETGAQLDGYEIHHGATVAGATATPTLSGPGRPARLAHRQRARELRARPARARVLPRRAARARGHRAGATPREPRRPALGDRRARARRGRLAAHPRPRRAVT